MVVVDRDDGPDVAVDGDDDNDDEDDDDDEGDADYEAGDEKEGWKRMTCCDSENGDDRDVWDDVWDDEDCQSASDAVNQTEWIPMKEEGTRGEEDAS